MSLKRRVTDTVKVSILSWDDVIDRTALGFDQLKPPGLAEVTALDAGARRSPLPTPHATVLGPSTCRAAAARSSAWRDSSCRPRSPRPSARCSTASPCRRARAGAEPITLPAGEQELLISPGAAFVVDGVQLAGPLARQLHTAATVPALPSNVERRPPRARRPAVGVVAGVGGAREHQPGLDGAHWRRLALDPVTVNGWQQGWVLPPGTAGPVTLSFASNTPYRAGLIGGLALLPLLALLAFLPVRGRVPPDEPARPWQPGPVATSAAVIAAAGACISGIAGPSWAARHWRMR